LGYDVSISFLSDLQSGTAKILHLFRCHKFSVITMYSGTPEKQKIYAARI